MNKFGPRDCMTTPLNATLGWEEWVGLPDLGLPSLKAKIDTGARTSALHARSITPCVQDGQSWVKFAVHPVPRHPAIEIACRAPLLGQRVVTSSNGEPENRFVIETELEIGDQRWPIEITLTNRESMRFRMLIGRQALQPGILINPSSSFLQPRRSHKIYRKPIKGL
jgi:ribosomal protein S6--L-glutamate ligase